MPGWVNIDSNRASAAQLLVDLRGGLPSPAGSVRLAYSEHVIEHLDVAVSRRWLRDLAAAMVPGGVFRVATPDLRFVAAAYLGDWKDQEWLREPAYQSITNAATMFNLAMRGWGHRFLFDMESLNELLLEAGFSSVKRCAFGESDHTELRNRETRVDSTLIIEAVR